jgi:hypothetical protein
MDPRAIDLALLDFEHFNESSRRAGKSSLLDPRERRIRLPHIPIGVIAGLLTTIRSAVGARIPTCLGDSAGSPSEGPTGMQLNLR